MIQPEMIEPDPKMSGPKPNRRLLPAPHPDSAEPKQRRMMVIALTLLLVALGFVLFRDRDFWFPDAQEAPEPATQPDFQPALAAPPTDTPAIAKTLPPARATATKTSRTAARRKADDSTPAAASTPPVSTIERTVLPPLEVEVVAGNIHRTVNPGSNSVHVDLQPGSPTPPAPDASSAERPADKASLTNAAERVEMSADASEIVSRPVKPGYPLLARQMRVQGSVILQALISRDGAIQDLHVMSGPPILAGAAQEAVRQWHFKPHYLGAQTVETQAKITVNFTISTN